MPCENTANKEIKDKATTDKKRLAFITTPSFRIKRIKNEK
jgi:hypothetical protein